MGTLSRLCNPKYEQYQPIGEFERRNLQLKARDMGRRTVDGLRDAIAIGIDDFPPHE